MMRYAKLASLLAAVAVTQAMLYPALWKPEEFYSHPELPELERAIREKSDIFLFGDSILGHTAAGESRDDRLDQMLVDQFAGCQTAVFQHQAYHSTVYRAYIDFIAAQNYRPQLLIVPINLRSFGPTWLHEPGFQFDDLLIAGREGGNPFFHVLLALHANDTSIFDEMTDPAGIRLSHDLRTLILNQEGLTDDELDAITAASLERDYLYDIPPTHRRVIDLVRIARMSRDHDLPLLMYFTPIDYEQGVDVLGDGFREHVQSNIDHITALLEPYGVIPLNLAFDVPHESFSYEVVVNEHLTREGREYVRAQVTIAARDRLTCLD